LFDAGGRVIEALLDTGGSRMGVEKILADIDADQDSAHEKDLLESPRTSHEDRRRSCSSW
jgi:hypothetical protein